MCTYLATFGGNFIPMMFCISFYVLISLYIMYSHSYKRYDIRTISYNVLHQPLTTWTLIVPWQNGRTSCLTTPKRSSAAPYLCHAPQQKKLYQNKTNRFSNNTTKLHPPASSPDFFGIKTHGISSEDLVLKVPHLLPCASVLGGESTCSKGTHLPI